MLSLPCRRTCQYERKRRLEQKGISAPGPLTGRRHDGCCKPATGALRLRQQDAGQPASGLSGHDNSLSTAFLLPLTAFLLPLTGFVLPLTGFMLSCPGVPVPITRPSPVCE